MNLNRIIKDKALVLVLLDGLFGAVLLLKLFFGALAGYAIFIHN